MKETVHFSKRQKAVIAMIIKQFRENCARGLYEYDPVEAYQDLDEAGDLIKNELDTLGQMKTLKELSIMDLGIHIDFAKNEYNPKGNYWYDGLHNCISADVDPDDPNDSQREERLQARMAFGTVYIRADIHGIKRIQAMCDEGYRAALKFIDDCNYCVECSRGEDFHEIYNFPTLHAGKRPQLILRCVIDHKDDEEPTVSKKTINNEALKHSISLAPEIGPKESISSSVFDDVSMAVLSYFFDFQPNSARFEGYVRDDLTGADIAVFEENCISSSI